MECPKCKNPNPPEATYCNMCYEKFLHSAADAYLRTMRLARKQRGEMPSETGSSGARNRNRAPGPSFADRVNSIPWTEIRDRFHLFFSQFGRPFLYIGILIAAGFA